MSVVELKQHVEGHITFSKQDVFQNLGSTTPEVESQNMGIPQGDPITLPTIANVRDTEPSPTEVEGTDNTTPSSPRCPPKGETPLAEPATSPAKADVKDTLPSPAETPHGEDTMVLLAGADINTPKDLPTAKVETQVVLTTRLVVELTGPLTPSNQAEEDRWCVLTVTTSMGKLNLEATRVTPGDTVTASVRRVAFGNPQMAATLWGPTKERKAVSHQDATIEEQAEKDLAEDCL